MGAHLWHVLRDLSCLTVALTPPCTELLKGILKTSLYKHAIQAWRPVWMPRTQIKLGEVAPASPEMGNTDGILGGS